MKKTIIALLALSSSALADTSLMEQAYIGFSDFSSGKADYGTMIDDITVSTLEGVTTLSGVTFDTPVSDTNTRDCFSITLVLDAAKIGSVTSFTSLAAGYYSATGAMGVGVNADGKFQGQWGTGGFTSGTPATPWTAGNVPATGSITLTFVTGVYTGTTDGSRIYVNDSTIFYSNQSLKTGGQTYRDIKINNLSGAIQQVYVHNTCLTQAQVGTLMSEIASIPEPTTATLSLLALAGLAARRRRK